MSRSVLVRSHQPLELVWLQLEALLAAVSRVLEQLDPVDLQDQLGLVDLQDQLGLVDLQDLAAPRDLLALVDLLGLADLQDLVVQEWVLVAPLALLERLDRPP